MPMQMLRLRPGVNSELTASQNEAGYSESALIRFRNALAEKVGGWTKYYAFAVGGIPKALHAWLDLNENEYLAVGTTTVLGSIFEGVLTNISPQQKITNFAPKFSTVSSTPNVKVDDSNISGITTFDSVEFLTPVAVGGLILAGVYPVALNLGTTTYRIIDDQNATSTVNDTGAVPVFTTTAGSATVSVLLTAHGLSVGGTINFPIATVLSTTGNDTYAKVLLHLNGTDTSTTITDSNAGGSAHTWTANGNAQIDTAAFKFGGASLLCDGTGDYVTTPDSTDFTLGTNDFTADCWFNCTATGGSDRHLWGQVANGLGASVSIRAQRTTANVIQARASIGGSPQIITGTTQFTDVLNTGWHHMAFVRTGNTLKLFIDGVQEGGDLSVSGSVNDSTNNWSVGRAGENTTDTWQGWIDEFRLSNGVARWTTTFTPPTAEYGTAAVQILGTYDAVTITDANNFTIALNSVVGDAGVFAMNGGLVSLRYFLAQGPVSATSGYGIGTYSSGGYSTGSTTTQQTGTNITATDWTLDNWGQVLLACPDGDGIYQWTPNSGLQNAEFIGTAPAKNTGIFIATEIQIAIAFGSTTDLDIGIDQDPLLVKWSAQGDYTDWTVTLNNQAGSRRLSTGSKIVGGLAAPQFNLLWTDIGLWAMNYIGFPDVFGFNPIGYGCGLVGKHAHGRLGSNIYWMSQSDFFVLGGGAPQSMPCTVWDKVFQDLNATYQHKSWAWPNSPFNEIWWFYPRASTNATEPDAYVKYNIKENTWDSGALDRTAGINQSILGMPIAAASTSLIYQHETGYNDDGNPITASFTTGDWQLSEGNDVLFVDWILPDMKFQTASGATTSASVQITFYSSYYPGGPQETHGPYTFTSTTTYINTRIRGRLLSMKIESTDLNSWWRIGGIRFRGAPDGRL